MRKNIYVKTTKLKKERQRQKLTYRDMSKKMGYNSSASYYNIETGKTIPNLKQINQICEILGQPAEFFFNMKVQQS